jgi:hypothetical protein
MQEILGKPYLFILSIITQWGTQVAMLKSVQRVALTLQKFFTNLSPDYGESIMELQPLIWDRQFWVNVDFITKLLVPINELIKMSESDYSSYSMLFPGGSRPKSTFNQ